MKEDNHQAGNRLEDNHQEILFRECPAAYVSNRLYILFILFVIAFVSSAHGQCLQNSTMFHSGELVNYDVYFKWGMLMPKAGTASMSITESTYQNTPAWHTKVLINSAGLVDKFFSIKDTMQNYITKEKLLLLYSGKRTFEGGYYEMDDLSYTYKNNKTYIHAIRKNLNRVKADTVLVGGECVLDLLGSFMYTRTIIWEDLNIGVEYPLEVGMGKSLIKVRYRYEGQQVVERDNAKFRTRLFVIDIYDDAFTESKEAMEIWIGDDDNHIPIKMRAKLKIGAMEAYFKSAKNLKYPLTCKVEVPK